MIATCEAPKPRKARQACLASFLAATRGKDTLLFDSSEEATEAARVLRARHPDIHVTASYNKVRLSIQNRGNA